MIETTPLYNGEILVEFNEARHTYVIIINGKKHKVPSVTRVTSVIDKSGPLVGWAINKTLDVVRGSLEVDTPYSSVFLEAVFDAAKKQSRRVKEEAADVGHRAHSIIEEYCKNHTEPILSTEDSRVGSCVDAALKWIREQGVEFISNERPVYSRRYRYSGRLDGLATVDGKLALVDWKTSNGVYPEYRIQTAAYQGAYEEETGERIETRYIIRLGKTDGIFEPHVYPRRGTFRKDFEAFTGALRLWKRLQTIEKDSNKKGN